VIESDEERDLEDGDAERVAGPLHRREHPGGGAGMMVVDATQHRLVDRCHEKTLTDHEPLKSPIWLGTIWPALTMAASRPKKKPPVGPSGGSVASLTPV
jgi:hypothetical protein